jgi:hypothetical protein
MTFGPVTDPRDTGVGTTGMDAPAAAAVDGEEVPLAAGADVPAGRVPEAGV